MIEQIDELLENGLQGVGKAIDGMYIFTTLPTRMSSWLGLLGGIFTACIALVVSLIVIRLVSKLL